MWWDPDKEGAGSGTLRFGSTAKALAECKLKVQNLRVSRTQGTAKLLLAAMGSRAQLSSYTHLSPLASPKRLLLTLLLPRSPKLDCTSSEHGPTMPATYG